MITDLDQQAQGILFFVLLVLFVRVETGSYQLLDADCKLGNPLPRLKTLGVVKKKKKPWTLQSQTPGQVGSQV